MLIDQMREKRKSRTNSGSGASAPGRIELAFTVMATMSVEQAWGWGRYSKVGFGAYYTPAWRPWASELKT